jgi:predicted nucleic acid-binding protein
VGLIVDTGVFVVWERKNRAVDRSQWASYGEAALSVITASELLTAVWRADSEERRKKRPAFVEGVLWSLPIKDVTLAIARCHAEIFADLATRGMLIGAHDLLIAATAIHHQYGVLTTNSREFSRVPGLQVVVFPS